MPKKKAELKIKKGRKGGRSTKSSLDNVTKSVKDFFTQKAELDL